MLTLDRPGVTAWGRGGGDSLPIGRKRKRMQVEQSPRYACRCVRGAGARRGGPCSAVL